MKTKLFAVVLAGLAGCLLVAADEGPAEKAKKELDAIQGTWNGVSGEENGMALDKATAEAMQLIIKGDKYTLKIQGNEVEQGTLKLDPSKTPKAVDIKITSGEDKGKDQFGFYEVEKDTLKLNVARPGKERPKDFGAKAGSEASLFVFKKPK